MMIVYSANYGTLRTLKTLCSSRHQYNTQFMAQGVQSGDNYYVSIVSKPLVVFQIEESVVGDF